MDTIGDFLSIIRNAVSAGKEKADMPSSNIRKNLAAKLEQYGYIRGFRVVDDGKQGMMRVYLKYDEKNRSAIQAIKRVSKPSCRRYIKASQIKDIRSGYGLTIISANEGILSGQEARKSNSGGEVLCEVW